jgi:hypothetical protein
MIDDEAVRDRLLAVTGFNDVEEFLEWDSNDAFEESMPGKQRAEIAIISEVRRRDASGADESAKVKKMLDLFEVLPVESWTELEEGVEGYQLCLKNEGTPRRSTSIFILESYDDGRFIVQGENGANVDEVSRSRAQAEDLAYALATKWKEKLDAILAERAPVIERSEGRSLSIGRRDVQGPQQRDDEPRRRITIRPKQNPSGDVHESTDRPDGDDWVNLGMNSDLGEIWMGWKFGRSDTLEFIQEYAAEVDVFGVNEVLFHVAGFNDLRNAGSLVGVWVK